MHREHAAVAAPVADTEVVAVNTHTHHCAVIITARGKGEASQG